MILTRIGVAVLVGAVMLPLLAAVAYALGRPDPWDYAGPLAGIIGGMTSIDMTRNARKRRDTQRDPWVSALVAV